MADNIVCKSGIYRIRNIESGKLYIGSTANFDKRFALHRATLATGTHHNRYLQFAWQKYGADAFAFEIVEYVRDKRQVLSREQFWIDATNAYGSGYNMCPTAGNCAGRKFSAATKRKMSESARRKPPMSEETRRKISETQKAVPASVRERIAELHRGQKRSAETRKRMSLAQRGKTHGESTRAKLAEIARNMPQEQRDKIAASLRGRKNGPASPEVRARMSEGKRRGWARRKLAAATSSLELFG